MDLEWGTDRRKNGLHATSVAMTVMYHYTSTFCALMRAEKYVFSVLF